MFISPTGTPRPKHRPHDYLDAMQPESTPGSTLRTILRCALGWLVGYLISSVSSILFFIVGHISPAKPASTTVMWITAIYGIVFAVLGAVVGANFSRKNAIGIGAAVAMTIVAAAVWSWYMTPTHAHWTQTIAVFLMAPAAQFGALFRRNDD